MIANLKGLYRIADLPLGDRRFADLPNLRGHVDALYPSRTRALRVAGWMASPGQPLDDIEVYLNGQRLFTTPILPREDVHQVFPWLAHADATGFDFELPLGKDEWLTTTRLDLIGRYEGTPRGKLSHLVRSDVNAFPEVPEEYMYRVAHMRDSHAFRVSGLKTFGDFLDAAAPHVDFSSVNRVLDWGCGCGRVTMYWTAIEDGPSVAGCDVDPRAVQWCNEHLEAGTFSTLQPLPPTAYADGEFDLIFAYSVLTHLPHDVQFVWLAEINRLLKPGGTFVATTHGQMAWAFDRCSLDAAFPAEGIVDAAVDMTLGDVVPEGYYRGTFQSKDYTLRAFGEHFDILDYVEAGASNVQDIVVMRKAVEKRRAVDIAAGPPIVADASSHVDGLEALTARVEALEQRETTRASRARVLAGSANVRSTARPFSAGGRPVIRWIKGDGRDDEITRSAIGQATRLFGDAVDYCLCTAELSPARARSVLAWAEQPVELWPLRPQDNRPLFNALTAAGCSPDAFGYWWKWFPERVRPAAPEWILDGDMVITAAPAWFEAWRNGADPLRVTQDDAWDVNVLYGEYLSHVDLDRRLYSGLISLPPHMRYVDRVLDVLARQPLKPGHDGRVNMSEQGIIATAFGTLGAVPIPLSEFPFGRAFEESLNQGTGPRNAATWGYHFGNAFRMENKHFRKLVEDGVVYSRRGDSALQERFAWLQNRGQWGMPGSSLNADFVNRISLVAQQYVSCSVLEIGTSRGSLAAVLSACGCLVTTVDREDRGASANLDGMGIDVEIADAASFLRGNDRKFAMIVVDLHGNSDRVWDELWPLVSAAVEHDGALVLCNTHLWRMPEWSEETGLRWLTGDPPPGWSTEVIPDPLPGMVICRRAI